MYRIFPLEQSCLVLLLSVALCASAAIADSPLSTEASKSKELPARVFPNLLPTEPPLGQLEIVWRKRSTNGVDFSITRESQPIDGALSQRVGADDIQRRVFTGEDTYYGELPAQIRSGTDLVRFVLHGVARKDPDEGTVLNIDGAVIGFMADHDGKHDRKYVQLAAKSAGSDGTVEWIPLNIVISPQPQRHVPLPRLTLRFNRSAGTWTLYLGDAALNEGIPVLTESEIPTVSIRAGRMGDTARLMELSLTAPPQLRSQEPAGINSGRIDLKKELENGNSRIMIFGPSQ